MSRISRKLEKLFAEFEIPRGETSRAFFDRLAARVAALHLTGKDAERSRRLLGWLRKMLQHDLDPVSAFRSGVWFAILCLREGRIGRSNLAPLQDANAKKKRDADRRNSKIRSLFVKLTSSAEWRLHGMGLDRSHNGAEPVYKTINKKYPTAKPATIRGIVADLLPAAKARQG